MNPFTFDVDQVLAQRLQQQLSKVLQDVTPVPRERKSKGAKVQKQRAKRAAEVFDLITFSERAERVAARGGSDFEIAKSLKVDETTLMVWLQAFPALEAAVEKGRERRRRRLRRLQRPPCPKCGGLLDETIELFGDAFSIIKKVPRCLVCGKRFYRTMTPVTPRASSRGKR